MPPSPPPRSVGQSESWHPLRFTACGKLDSFSSQEGLRNTVPTVFNLSWSTLPWLLPFLPHSKCAHSLSAKIPSHYGFTLRLNVQGLPFSASAQAAITECHRLGGMNSRSFFSHGCGGREPEIIRAPAPSADAEASLPALRTATFSL